MFNIYLLRFLILMRIEAEKNSFIFFFHPSSKLLLLMIIHYPIILKFFSFSLWNSVFHSLLQSLFDY